MARKLKKKIQKYDKGECEEVSYFRPIFFIIPILIIIAILILLSFVFLNKIPEEIQEKNSIVYVQMYAGPGADAMISTVLYWNQHYSKETGIFVRTFPLKSKDYFDKLKVELLSGISSPDIVNVFSLQLGELSSYLQPLDNYLKNDEIMTDPNLTRLSIDSLIPITIKAANGSDGKIYLLPNEMNGVILYYRKDLISNPPQTWDELLELAKNNTQSLNKNSTTKYGIFLSDKYDPWTFCTFLEIFWSYDGEIFLKNNENPGFDSNKSVMAFNVFEELTNFNATWPSMNNLENADVVSIMQAGDVAMALEWSDIYPDLVNGTNNSMFYDKFEIAPPPGVKQQDGSIKKDIYFQTSNLAINKNSKNKIAAMKFLVWATLGEGAKIYADNRVPTSLSPLKPLPAGLNTSNSFLLHNQIFSLFEQYGHLVPLHPEMVDIMFLGSSHMQRIMSQNENARQAASELNSDILNLLNGRKN